MNLHKIKQKPGPNNALMFPGFDNEFYGVGD